MTHQQEVDAAIRYYDLNQIENTPKGMDAMTDDDRAFLKRRRPVDNMGILIDEIRRMRQRCETLSFLNADGVRRVYKAFQYDGTGGAQSNGIYETLAVAELQHDPLCGPPEEILVFSDGTAYRAHREEERRQRALSKLTADEKRLLGL